MNSIDFDDDPFREQWLRIMPRFVEPDAVGRAAADAIAILRATDYVRDEHGQFSKTAGDIAPLGNESMGRLREMVRHGMATVPNYEYPQEAVDSIMRSIGEERGFGKPQIVSPEGLSAKVADGWQPVFRGVERKEWAEDLRTGPYRPAFGALGSGIYATTSLSKAAEYATEMSFNHIDDPDYTPTVAAMAISPTARSIDWADAVRQSQAETKNTNYNDPDSLLLAQNVGRWAAIRGYDLVTDERHDPSPVAQAFNSYRLILNPNVLAISSQDLPQDKSATETIR